MIDDIIPHWYAIHTRYKSEKIVIRLLRQKQIDCYLPLQKRYRKHGTKRIVSELPLISCYAFVNINKEDYIKVLETEFVVGFVRFAKDIFPIPDIEFNLMRRIVGEDVELTVEKYTFYEGDAVEIAQGNLAGIRGKMVEIEGKNRILVELEHLGFNLQISIDKQQLIKV
ncbi:MAG: transcription termination/antitermination protein NusG [Saprospiraceae bacterium]